MEDKLTMKYFMTKMTQEEWEKIVKDRDKIEYNFNVIKECRLDESSSNNNVTAYDSKGEEMEIPKCKNGHYKCQVIGKKYSQWVCLQCGEV